MEPTLHGNNRCIPDIAIDQLSLVRFYGRFREMRDLMVRDAFLYLNMVDQLTKSCSQYDAYTGRLEVLEKGCCVFYLLLKHGFISYEFINYG
jgi:hypothetical protein